MNKKTAIFVCVENSCRSQMAEGLMNFLGKDIFEAYSAGSKPSGKINPLAIEVMKEIGISISKNKTKSFNDLPVEYFDYTISLGCNDTCPFIAAKKHIEWNIPDPKNKSRDFFRKTRDLIKKKIQKLIDNQGEL